MRLEERANEKIFDCALFIMLSSLIVVTLQRFLGKYEPVEDK